MGFYLGNSIRRNCVDRWIYDFFGEFMLSLSKSLVWGHSARKVGTGATGWKSAFKRSKWLEIDLSTADTIDHFFFFFKVFDMYFLMVISDKASFVPTHG